MFHLDSFIYRKVVRRPGSLFRPDLDAHAPELSAFISGARVLVIGGAGSIGSSFIRALLPYRPGALVVVDTSENALAELTRDLRSTAGMFWELCALKRRESIRIAQKR